jgi:serine/threonine protein kinase
VSFIQENGPFDEVKAKEIFQQIISAVEYCHQSNIIHRDLKLDNILLTNKDCEVVKIVDFGISGISNNVIQNVIQAGSLRYMAPESFQG